MLLCCLSVTSYITLKRMLLVAAMPLARGVPFPLNPRPVIPLTLGIIFC